MLIWLSNNIGIIITVLVLAAIVALALGNIIRGRRKGKSSCGCGCSNCTLSTYCRKDK